MADKGYSLSLIIKAVDRVTGPFAGDLRQGQGGQRRQYRGRSIRVGLPVFTNSFKNVGGAIGGVGSAVASSTQKAAWFGGDLGLQTAALNLFFQGFLDGTGAIGDTAERTGINCERFQELSFAAKLARVIRRNSRRRFAENADQRRREPRQARKNSRRCSKAWGSTSRMHPAS